MTWIGSRDAVADVCIGDEGDVMPVVDGASDAVLDVPEDIAVAAAIAVREATKAVNFEVVVVRPAQLTRPRTKATSTTMSMAMPVNMSKPGMPPLTRPRSATRLNAAHPAHFMTTPGPASAVGPVSIVVGRL